MRDPNGRTTDRIDATAKTAFGGAAPEYEPLINAANRFIVTNDVYASFLEKLSAALAAVKSVDRTAPDSTIGSLSSKIAANWLDDQAKRAIA